MKIMVFLKEFLGNIRVNWIWLVLFDFDCPVHRIEVFSCPERAKLSDCSKSGEI